MLTRVTITGADDSIHPGDLKIFTKLYPFIEWGILVSKKNFGVPRYPTLNWLNQLKEVKDTNIGSFNLSCHLCGRYVRELVIGKDTAIQELGDLWNIFERIQINFHGIKHNTTEDMINLLLKYPEKEFIFQYDDVNIDAVHMAYKAGVNCSALFDRSGGAGILPDEWPEPIEGIKCGYAGGLSPHNLEKQIKIIENIVGDEPFWIDMETHVRTADNKNFDLNKVEACLQISMNQ